MCGIVGVFGEGAGHREGDIERMLASIRSRGEVDEVQITDRWSVGVRRLRIVDRDRAVQPIANGDGTCFVIFNGEIFNHRALRERLAPDHVFSTQSDTETILHAYEAYGERCVEHLDGQFAFAIHDTRTGAVFAARDPMGVVPLYFVRDGATLVLASTIGALTFLDRRIHAVPPGHTRSTWRVGSPRTPSPR